MMESLRRSRRQWCGDMLRAATGWTALIGSAGAEPFDALVGGAAVSTSPALVLELPDSHRHLAVFPARLISRLEATRELHLFVHGHSVAHAASLVLFDGLLAELGAHLNLEHDCRITGLALTDAGWFRTDGQAVGEPNACAVGFDTSASGG